MYDHLCEGREKRQNAPQPRSSCSATPVSSACSARCLLQREPCPGVGLGEARTPTLKARRQARPRTRRRTRTLMSEQQVEPKQAGSPRTPNQSRRSSGRRRTRCWGGRQAQQRTRWWQFPARWWWGRGRNRLRSHRSRRTLLRSGRSSRSDGEGQEGEGVRADRRTRTTGDPWRQGRRQSLGQSRRRSSRQPVPGTRSRSASRARRTRPTLARWQPERRRSRWTERQAPRRRRERTQTGCSPERP